jgi:hypothetical protein
VYDLKNAKDLRALGPFSSMFGAHSTWKDTKSLGKNVHYCKYNAMLKIEDV